QIEQCPEYEGGADAHGALLIEAARVLWAAAVQQQCAADHDEHRHTPAHGRVVQVGCQPIRAAEGPGIGYRLRCAVQHHYRERGNPARSVEAVEAVGVMRSGHLRAAGPESGKTQLSCARRPSCFEPLARACKRNRTAPPRRPRGHLVANEEIYWRSSPACCTSFSITGCSLEICRVSSLAVPERGSMPMFNIFWRTCGSCRVVTSAFCSVSSTSGGVPCGATK